MTSSQKRAKRKKKLWGLAGYKTTARMIRLLGIGLDFDQLVRHIHIAHRVCAEVKLGNEWACSLFAPGFSSPYTLDRKEAQKLTKYFDVFFCYKYWSYDPMAAHYRVYPKDWGRFMLGDKLKGKGHWVDDYA